MLKLLGCCQVFCGIQYSAIDATARLLAESGGRVKDISVGTAEGSVSAEDARDDLATGEELGTAGRVLVVAGLFAREQRAGRHHPQLLNLQVLHLELRPEQEVFF